MSTEMEELTLGCCGVTVFYPKDLVDDRRKTGETFYCPNGHSRVFRETTAQKLQKELDAVKSDLKAKRDKLESIKTGKCPWCWKTVKNLSAHIERNHK